MITKKTWRFLVVALLIIILTIPTSPGMAAATQDVLVTFYQPPGPNEINLIQSLGGTVKTVYHLVPTIAATMPADKLDQLRRDPRVKMVTPDTVLPANPDAGIKAGLQAGILSQTLPWGVDRIDAEMVHPTNKGTGVKVAILDSGIDLDHPDLAVAGNVTFVPGTSSGDDDNGHGTMVAGIVGALDNAIGVIGVAPEASLYAVKVLDQYGNGQMSVILSGIQWAVDNQMKVMYIGCGGLLSWPETLVDALTAAYNSGIVIISGAGNGGTPDGQGDNIWCPARLASVIAVGATDQTNARWASSSTGWDLELMGPGVDIYTTAMGGGYGYMTGTSASSAHAAGAAALLIRSGLTNGVDVRYRMRNSAQDLGAAGWDTQYGNGMVNAYLAINFSEPPDQSAPVTTISLSGTKGNFDWYVSNVTVTLSATDSGSGVAQTKYSLDQGQTWTTYSSPLSITTDGSYYIMARSWDNAGNDEGPPVFQAFKIDKTPPTLTETVTPTQIASRKKGFMVRVDYSLTVSDSGSGALPFNHQLIDEYGTLSQDLGPHLSDWVGVEARCDGNDKDGRHYTFHLTAQDLAGNVAYADAVVTVVR